MQLEINIQEYKKFLEKRIFEEEGNIESEDNSTLSFSLALITWYEDQKAIISKYLNIKNRIKKQIDNNNFTAQPAVNLFNKIEGNMTSLFNDTQFADVILGRAEKIGIVSNLLRDLETMLIALEGNQEDSETNTVYRQRHTPRKNI